MNLKDLLRNELDSEEIKELRRGFEIVGDIAIVEIPEGLEKKEKSIAEAIKRTHPRIKTVLKKLGKRNGEFRLRKFKIILGNETETIHREYGCLFKLDLMKVYFSPRESTERQRIAEQVKPKERILVMFAGIGPYAIIIGKKQPEIEHIYAIEINPDAYKYMEENIKINKMSDKITPILNNVNNIRREYFNLFDRIVMPLPKGAHKFLNIAFKYTKKHGYIHFYHWASEERLYKEALKIIIETAQRSKRKVRILRKRKVLPYSPMVWKICIDFKVY